MYTHPRFLAENARWAGHLARDGAVLVGDLAGGKLGVVPTVLVSATSHPLHIQQPGKVAQAVLALLERA